MGFVLTGQAPRTISGYCHPLSMYDSASLCLLLITLLLVKHFIWDFYFQPPYMWKNKGTFGHPGGILHSGIHAASSFSILVWWTSPLFALFFSLFEFSIHYLTDFAKMNINRSHGWACNTHDQFWQLTGLDQLIHQLTYIIMVYAVVS